MQIDIAWHLQKLELSFYLRPHWRGFAVVADEVRKLAERTARATNEVTSMIKEVQANTHQAVSSMNVGLTEVEKGRQLTDKAGNSLNEIVTMSDRVMQMGRQISVAASEISRNVEAVLSVTHETVKGTEHSAAAAEQLSRQAENLKSMVAEFVTR